ncbi:hypothetical protein CA600_28570 [Paenibacillus sp. VTT E-133280]|nr:DUF2933 domain-containing protein [Acinetobacter sp. CUI P1]MDH6373011.1 hypothetical protein [Paenibacillus sp. PastF-3]OZQ60347.1 hypothetical protein CA600_28570 [Paenibacillus sp. VTT E-133280]OZQ85096.1 hypothetical protein CA598_21920 [Paenibacillus sp. VTT E-133291]
MSCCGNHNHGKQAHEDNGHDHGEIKKHGWFMKLCCILPIVLIGIMLVANSSKGASSNILTYSLLLICPLSHLILMPLMMRKRNIK